MKGHEPKNYSCPFCLFLKGIEDKRTLLKKSDLVFETNDIAAFISVKWWENNPGHVIVIPKQHVENIYEISDDLLAKVALVSKTIAKALKNLYGCDGSSIRQHNEPAGNQDIWHFHQHVFPRWLNDNLYTSQAHFVSAEQRAPYAEKLRRGLNQF